MQTSPPIFGKYSHKLYTCTKCGTVKKEGTNHWGEIYPYCQKCAKQTTWQCLEPVPEGMSIPEPWAMVRLGDVIEVIKEMKSVRIVCNNSLHMAKG